MVGFVISPAVEEVLTTCRNPCLRKTGQRRRDDHLLPTLDPQFVEQRSRRNAGIIDENVKLAEPLTCQLEARSKYDLRTALSEYERNVELLDNVVGGFR